jgi:hypothetical protein
MSGPKTSSYSLADVREREAAEQRHREEAAEQRRREEERRQLAELKAARQSAKAATQKHRALSEDLRRLQERFPGEQIAVKLSKAPHDPDSDSRGDLDRYTEAMSRLIAEFERQLAAESSRATANTQFREALSAVVAANSATPRTAAELFSSLARRSAATAKPAVNRRARSREARLKALVERGSDVDSRWVPDDLRALLEEFFSTPSEARADALEMEINLRIQRLQEDRECQNREQREAEELLAVLPHPDESAPRDNFEARKLVHQLLLVTLGEARLTADLRERALAASESARARDLDRRQQLASQVLNSALGDLGYEVEPIASTLFIEGGTVHFQRAEWGDYYVRMRVYPDREQINFNMIRVEASGNQGEDWRRQDALLETSWCSEMGIQQLMKTLAARGLHLNMLRAVKAGELPVQVVKSEALPERLRRRRSMAAAARAAGVRRAERPVR